MYLENQNFTKNYLNQAITLFESKKNRVITKNEKENLIRILKERLENQNFEEISLYNNNTEESKQGNIKSLIELCYKPNTIISSYGALFDASKDELNYPGKMLDKLKSSRKTVKKEMFKYINTDKNKFNILDSEQNSIKLIMNSYFGVLGTNSFISFNNLIPPCITYTGVATTTTVLMAMESHLGDNIGFIDINDFYTYCTNCYQDFKEVKFNFKEVIDVYYDKKDAIKLLVDYFIPKFESNDYTIEEVENHLSSFTEENLNRLIYKRNLFKFLNNEYVINLLEECFSLNFLDPNEPPEDVKEKCELLYELVREFTGYVHLYDNRYDRICKLKRKIVLTTDTDSVFIRLSDFVDFYLETFDIESLDNTIEESIIIICNIITYLNSRFISDILYKFTSNMNVIERRKRDINMKSEMLMSRLVTTNNKKWYVGKIMLTVKFLNFWKDLLKSIRNISKNYYVNFITNNTEMYNDYFYNESTINSYWKQELPFIIIKGNDIV